MAPTRRTSKRKLVEVVEMVKEPPSVVASTSTTSQPLLPSLPKLSLGLKLFQRRESDALADMLFSLEDGQLIVPAHLLIVREGSNTLEEMINRRRVKNTHKKPEIQVPKEAGSTIFDIFLKFLYDECTLPTPSQLKDDILSKLLLLADHFAVEELYEKCCSILREKLKPQNCVEVFQTTLQLTKNELCDLAFHTILENVDNLMSGDNDDDMVEWSWKIWQYTLPQLSGEQLVNAFKALKRWRDHDPTKREETFHRLGKCIRFRLFGSAAAAADSLESTGILSQTEMVSLFMHFAGGHKTINVTPSQDLQEILSSCTSGSRIRLAPGTYKGMFVISHKDTKVIGSGSTSEIWGRLVVDSDECEVADLNMVLVDSAMSEKDASSALTTSGGGGQPLIFVRGNSNSLMNVGILSGSKGNNVQQEQKETPSKPKRRHRTSNPISEKNKNVVNATVTNTDALLMSAILCSGNHNKLVNIVTQLPTINVMGDDNRVDVIQFQSTLNGVHVQGDNNIVNDIMFFPLSSSLTQNNSSVVLNISGGRENVVTNLNAFQVPASYELSLLKIGPDSASTRVRNCAGADVYVNGSGHELVGVKLSPRFSFGVEGANHQLVDCTAEQFTNTGKGITITNCEFY